MISAFLPTPYVNLFIIQANISESFWIVKPADHNSDIVALVCDLVIVIYPYELGRKNVGQIEGKGGK